MENCDIVLFLLPSRIFNHYLSKEALELVKEEWDWDVRADFIYKNIVGIRCS